MKIVFMIFAGVSGLLALTWAFQGNDFFLYSVFAPKYEVVRRNTFEQSRAFNEGMAQELQRMQLDYQRAASDDERAALRSVVRHRVAGYDVDRLENPQLRGFVKQMLQGS